MAEVLTESFCERCGTRYTFESAKPRVKRLGGVKVLSRGLKNFVLSDDSSLDEAMAAARSDTEREVTSQQLDAFHKTFNFCMTCRQYTCANCWNEAEGACLTCSPHLGHEILPAPFPNLDPLGTTVALGATDLAPDSGPFANGANGNGHAAPAYDTGAWPSSDGWPSHDLTDDTPAADLSSQATSDIDEIDAAARMAALTAIGSGQATAPDPVEVVPTDHDTAIEAIDPAPVEIEAAREPEPEPAQTTAIGGPEIAAEPEPAFLSEPVVEPEPFVEPEPTAAAAAEADIAPPVRIQPATPSTPPGALSADEVAAAATAQTADLFHRFRPGESLDAELDAYERQYTAPAAPVVADAVESEPVVAGTEVAEEPPTTPIAVDALIAAAGAGVLHHDPEPSVEAAPEAVEPEITAEAEPVATAEPVAEPVAVEPDPEPVAAEPVEDEPIAAAEPEAVAAEPEPEPVAAEPEPEPEPAPVLAVEPVAAEPEPEPIAAQPEPVATEPEPEPIAAQPEPVAAEPEADRAAEAAAAAAAAAAVAATRDRPTDVVAQPTWRIVAPEADPTPPVAPPTPVVPAAPAVPPVASAQPQWPAAPQWPDQRPSAGLPFLGRPVQPTGGLDSLWAESNREVAAAPAAAGRPVAPAGVQPCVSCGLSLSATARFCRRCGTAQR